MAGFHQQADDEPLAGDADRDVGSRDLPRCRSLFVGYRIVVQPCYWRAAIIGANTDARAGCR